MLTTEELKDKYKEVKDKYPDKDQYLLGWLDCILYIIGKQEND